MERPIDAYAASAKLVELYNSLTKEGEKDILRCAMEIIRTEPTLKAKTAPLENGKLLTMPVGDWVWIQVHTPFPCQSQVAAYYRKEMDFTRGRSFCCGYPGLVFTFDYADYGRTWTAYRNQPEGM